MSNPPNAGRLLLLVSLALGCATAPQRIPVTSLGDLPRHTYPIEGKVSDLVRSEAAFARFAAALRRDLEADLARYEIRDAATLRQRYDTLGKLYVLAGEYDRAVKTVEKAKALEDKAALRLVYGQQIRAMAAAHREAGGAPGESAFDAAFRTHFAEAYDAMPWETVRDLVLETKGMAEIMSPNLLMGVAESRLDPAIARSGAVSGDLAPAVVDLYFTLHRTLPLKDEIHSVCADLAARHATVKADIWPARELDLDPASKHAPVVVAVWDTGVDTEVLGPRVFVNPKETLDGRDDDGNGFVDDVHGIAFDLDGQASSAMLHPLGDQTGRIEGAMKHLGGLTDLQAGVESPAASTLRSEISAMDPKAVGDLLESLTFATIYAHGTHVAGILTRGNPFARVLVARIAFDYHRVPAPITAEVAERHAESYRRTAKYFRDHGVRVVNMSWGWSLKEIEQSLEANDLGGSAKARGEEARRILHILEGGLRDAIAGSPGILFVSSAGNDNDDPNFAENLPAMLMPLPNLMLVGAVDQAGARTAFTSSGRYVKVYANGFQVESDVPGGARMKFSGTSMSSPNVANLAAKLVTLRPDLKPEEVVALIEEGASGLPGDASLRLVDPKRTAGLLAPQAALGPPPEAQ